MPTFKAFMKDINRILIYNIGVDSDDLPDKPYRDWYEDEMTPTDAVTMILEEEAPDLLWFSEPS